MKNLIVSKTVLKNIIAKAVVNAIKELGIVSKLAVIGLGVDVIHKTIKGGVTPVKQYAKANISPVIKDTLEERRTERVLVKKAIERKRELIAKANDALTKAGLKVTGLLLKEWIINNYPETKKESLLYLNNLQSNMAVRNCIVKPLADRGCTNAKRTLTAEEKEKVKSIKESTNIMALENHIKSDDKLAVRTAKARMEEMFGKGYKDGAERNEIRTKVINMHRSGASNGKIASDLQLSRQRVGSFLSWYLHRDSWSDNKKV